MHIDGQIAALQHDIERLIMRHDTQDRWTDPEEAEFAEQLSERRWILADLLLDSGRTIEAWTQRWMQAKHERPVYRPVPRVLGRYGDDTDADPALEPPAMQWLFAPESIVHSLISWDRAPEAYATMAACEAALMLVLHQGWSTFLPEPPRLDPWFRQELQQIIASARIRVRHPHVYGYEPYR